MLSSYEVTVNGRTWHGNVRLKEYHLSERNGETVLFLVQDVAARRISPSLAGILRRIVPGSGTLIPDALMQELRSCGLVNGEPTSRSPVEAAQGADLPVASIALFLAQDCNLNCVYCYGQEGRYGSQGLMDESTARAAVDWLMENSLAVEKLHIGFFGGEPLLNFPVMKSVASYARKQAAARGKELKLGMTTNGTIVTDEIIAFLQQEEIEPMISFDGPAAIQNRQRPFRDGRASHAQVSANVQRLLAVFPRLTARATVMTGGDPIAARCGMEQAGFTRCILSYSSPVLLKGDAEGGSPDEHGETAERMLAAHRRDLANLFTDIAARRLDIVDPPFGLAMLAGLMLARQRHGTCGVGRWVRAIAVNGDLYPCHRFVGTAAHCMGNIRTEKRSYLNEYHRAAVDNLAACRGCWTRYICGGGCFYDNQARTGDMRRADPRFCKDMDVVCEDLLHGWCALSEVDRAWLREQLDRMDPDMRV